jgi:hypothetical protein
MRLAAALANVNLPFSSQTTMASAACARIVSSWTFWSCSASSASFRTVMFSWDTTARRVPAPENRVTLPMNQRRSVGEWQGYSISKLSCRPESTALIPSAKEAATSA